MVEINIEDQKHIKIIVKILRLRGKELFKKFKMLKKNLW